MRNPLEALGVHADCTEFEFLLVKSDLDGNLPVTSNAKFKSHFPTNILTTALTRPNFRQRIEMSIEGQDSEYHGILPLIISHRLVPELLGRQSIEKEDLPSAHTEEKSKVEVLRIHVHVDRILHLIDFSNLSANHDAFLYFSVTTPVMKEFFVVSQ